MPRTREQFSEMKDERRNSILNAALPLFSLNKKVSIDAICERAKCSHGIVYHYFRNTDQILEKLLKSPTSVELNNKLFNPNDGSSYEKIEEILSVLLDVSPSKFETVCYLNMIIKNNEKGSLRSVLTKLIKDTFANTEFSAYRPVEPAFFGLFSALSFAFDSIFSIKLTKI